jgi:hypothetical protein
MGVLGVITQACYINGMSEGDAAAMAPIDYTRLGFAVILGYALFNDIPNTMTMLGAGIVMASTIYITVREARRGKPQPPAEPLDKHITATRNRGAPASSPRNIGTNTRTTARVNAPK